MSRFESLRTRLHQYDAALHLVAQFVFAGARFFRELLVARLLGPVGMGYWSGLNIYRQYGAFSDLGFTNGLNRVMALYLHRGDEKSARSAMGLSFVVSMGSSGLFTVAAVAWFLIAGYGQDRLMLVGLVTVLLYMLIEKMYLYRWSILRSHQRVGEASSYTGLLGVLELALGIALTLAFGVTGLLISVVIAIAVTLAAMLVLSPTPLRPSFRFDKKVLRDLGAASLLMSLFGILGIASQNVDRIAVVAVAGAGAKLGVYSFASTLGLVVAHFSGVAMSFVTAKFYRYDSVDMESVRTMFVPVLAIVHVGTCLIASVVLLLAPPLIMLGFPAFERSIGLTGWLLLSHCCATAGLVASNAFFVLNRSQVFITIRIVTIAATAGGYALAWSFAGTLESIAIVNVAAGLGSSLVSAVFASRMMDLPMRRLTLIYALPLIAFGVLVAVSLTLSVQTVVLIGYGAAAALALGLVVALVRLRNLRSMMSDGSWMGLVQRWFRLP